MESYTCFCRFGSVWVDMLLLIFSLHKNEELSPEQMMTRNYGSENKVVQYFILFVNVQRFVCSERHKKKICYPDDRIKTLIFCPLSVFFQPCLHMNDDNVISLVKVELLTVLLVFSKAVFQIVCYFTKLHKSII